MIRTIGLTASIGLTLDSFFPELVREWQAEGLRVVSAAGTAAPTMPSHTELDGISREPSPRQARKAMSQLRDWCEANTPDVVVTNTATSSALIRLANIDKPVVYLCHGLHWGSRPLDGLHWKLAEWLLLARTDAVITLNSTDERWFKRRAGTKPQTRLQWGVGVDIERFRRTPIPGETKHLVWAGEFSTRKNPHAALDALELLMKRRPATILTMLGEGPLQAECKQRAFRDGLSRNVEFPGRVDPVPYISRAIAVVHTAAWEGLPRILLESLSMGRPVAAFAAKGVSDLPVHTAPQGDVVALVGAIESIMDGASQQFPDPNDLSYQNAATAISQALRQWGLL